jgi:predicted dehydrogenase
MISGNIFNHRKVYTMSTREELTAIPKLRFVVIGVGAGIFHLHQSPLSSEDIEVVAVADVNPETGQPRADELGCPFYVDHRQLLAEVEADVAVIITPHPFHAPLAIACLQAGLHVLVEKPIAVQVAEADAMLEAAQKAKRLLVVNFQQRYRPEIQAARKLIQEGALGQLQYVSLTAAWLRTAKYFNFAGWRGTWKGEGGGLLMNQTPHDLDLICYLVGMPERVTAWTQTQLHQIETEDTVTAMLAWPNGANGAFHASTAEAGLKQRFEILGTGGLLQLGRGQFSFERFETEIREYIKTSEEMYRAPGLLPEPVELPEGSGSHQSVYDNFKAAIREGAPLIVDGASAAMSLEVANAMIYSSYMKEEVTLPLDRQKYADLLADLKAKRGT